MPKARLLPLLALLCLGGPAAAHEPVPAARSQSSVERAAQPAAAVVDAFHAALRGGDTKGALALLSDDALIFEGGGVEAGKAEYASHHAAADTEFSKSVTAKQERRWARVAGPIAWVATENRMSGSFRGRSIDNRKMTETMVLKRVAGRWRITHIHWSMAD